MNNQVNPYVHTDCFAYRARGYPCNVCRELICAEKQGKCPFYKTPEQLAAAREKSEQRLQAISAYKAGKTV